MLKYILSAAFVVSALPYEPAQAARCPSGQIFRVSLKVCAPREKNLHFLHGASKVASVSPKDSARAGSPAKRPAPPQEDAQNAQYDRETGMNRTAPRDAAFSNADSAQPSETSRFYPDSTLLPDVLSLRGAPAQPQGNPFGALR